MENLQKVYNLVLTTPAIREQFTTVTNPDDAIAKLLEVATEHQITLSREDLEFVAAAEKSGHDQNHLGLDGLRWGLFSLIRVACVSAHRQVA